MDREFHFLSNLFPLDNGEKFTGLVDDIRQNGLQHPIVLYEGKILDGRSRYKACALLNLEPQTVDFESLETGEEPLQWLIKQNTADRDLKKPQLATVGLAMLNMRAGGIYAKELDSAAVAEVKEVAGIVDVGWTSLERLLGIQKRRPDLITRIRSGELTIAEAARAAGFTQQHAPVPGREQFQYARGDQFQAATEPLTRYLRGWKKRGFEFRHVPPKQAKLRLKTIDRLLEDLTAARADLVGRTVKASTAGSTPLVHSEGEEQPQ